MKTEMKRPTVFEYNRLNPFIVDFISYLVNVRKLSYRTIATKCKINSSGYVQNNVLKKGVITISFLDKFVSAFIPNAKEAKFLYMLFFIEHSNDNLQKSMLIDQLLQISKKSATKHVDDRSIYSHWINGVILESVNIKGLTSRSLIVKRLSRLLDKNAINEGITFLLKKGYLREMDDTLKIADSFEFKSFNDVQRSIEIQQNHSYFLNLAKSHLIDDLNKREFQGLTIAIKSEDLPQIKKIIRHAISEIKERFADDPEADAIYRVQIAAFKVC